MVWIAVVLAVFLFYKFVERPHKIIFFKVAGACTAFGALVVGGIVLYERFAPKEKVRSDISVEYSYHSSKLDKEIKRGIAEKLFSKSVQEGNYLLNGFSRDQLLVAKQVFFGFYLELKALDPIINVDPQEFTFLVDSWSDDVEKSKVARAKYIELQKMRLNKYTSDLPALRAKYVSETDRKYFGFILVAQINSLDDEFKNLVEKQLSPDEMQHVQNIRGEVESSAETITAEFNRLKPDTEIAFKICNKEDKPLNSYSFYVSGFDKGRSSPKKLEFDGYGDDTRFEGDIIIPSKKCSSINWTGKYKMFHRYEIKLINGTWASN